MNTNTNTIRFQNHNEYEYKYKYYLHRTQICIKICRYKHVKVQKKVKYSKSNMKMCQYLQKKALIISSNIIVRYQFLDFIIQILFVFQNLNELE